MKLTPEDLLARVLYRDAMLLVLDKPSGIAVHAGPGKGPNLEALFDHLRFGLPRAPALVHRLDRDTSGCLVLGRHRKALRKGGELFSGGRADKVYWALCVGAPQQMEGRVETFLRKKSERVSGWEILVCKGNEEGAQKAITDYKVLAVQNGYSLIEFYPRTGRTHQIRVHALHLGCALQGDPRYGTLSEADRAAPFCLHAKQITLPFYPKKDPIKIEAPLPAHFLSELARRGIDVDVAAAASIAAAAVVAAAASAEA